MASSDDRKERDQAILSRLAKIEHKVDALERTHAFALRAEAERHFESVRAIFGKSVRSAQVYLAANGARTVNEIADHLAMKAPHVSRALSKLQDEGLLELIDSRGSGSIYARTPVDRSLRIGRFLRQEFKLTADGLADAQP